jgi:hypothetical protein
VERHLAGQPAHHGARSFQEKFVMLLTNHQFKFDERYLSE